MQLEAMEVDVEVRVPGGVIVARASPGGTLAEVKVGEHDGQLKVVRGAVTAKLLGQDQQLTAGEEHSWELQNGQTPTVDDVANAQTGPTLSPHDGRRGQLVRGAHAVGTRRGRLCFQRQVPG